MSGNILSGSEGVFAKVPIGAEQRVPVELSYELDGGAAALLVRKAGAVIRSLEVGGVKVLTTGTFLDNAVDEQPLKIDAAHTMLPAGPSEFGPQHGPSRYLDYEIEQSTEGSAAFRAHDRLRNLGHTKEFALQPDGLEVTDRVESLGTEAVGISLGEHLYFNVAEEDLADIKFTDEDGSPTIIQGHSEDGREFKGVYSDTVADISEGKTIIYENFSGSQLIDIPGTGRLKLTATAIKQGDNLPVCLFMWHRPGTNTVCFEPVTGFTVDNQGTRNDGIVMSSGENLELKSKIQLVYSD